MMLFSYNMINCPRLTPDVANGLVNLIKYPNPSYATKLHGVVVVVAVFNPLLQLLVSTAELTMIGLGINTYKYPPMSISF